jgi:dienelactone hydrolase
VEMPYAQRVDRPFLESGLAIGWPKALDDMSRAADRAGFAVAVIYGRGTVHDAPIGEADAFEAMSDMVSRYSIDRRKIYLFGASEGGRRAIMLAEHYPEVFAGVGVYGAGLGVTYSGPIPPAWVANAGVFAEMKNLSSIPVNFVEGEFDDEPPRTNLEHFFAGLKDVSPSSVLTEVPDGMHGTNEAEKIVFPWLAKFENSRQSVPIDDALKKALSKVN